MSPISLPYQEVSRRVLIEPDHIGTLTSDFQPPVRISLPGICTRKKKTLCSHRVVVQSLSCVQLFATPWTAACQAFLSFTISWSLLRLMSIKLVMPSNHLVLCRPLLLLPSIFPSIYVHSSFTLRASEW